MIKKIFLSAGEASGDLHGSRLVRALRSFDPQIRITCLGGSLLQQAGAEVLVDNRQIAVVGLLEVAHHLKAIYGAWQKIRDHLLREKPHVVILIDFPDFNFLLARQAKHLGIKVFYYISPQLWAWRSGRVHTLRRLVDEMAVILPFEQNFYARYGMRVHYVGHPLLDVLEEKGKGERRGGRGRDKAGEGEERRGEERVKEGAGKSFPCLGLLPGSRQSEIRALLPLLLDTAKILLAHYPEMSFLLPVAPTLDAHEMEAKVSRWCHEQSIRESVSSPVPFPLRVVSGDTYDVMRSCDLLLTASGTVTLEAAILGTPMVIVYKVSNLSYYMGRHLIAVRHVGLPNLIAGRSIVPEILQNEAQPDRVAAEAMRLLNHPEHLERQQRELSRIHGQLGEPGVSDRVARLVFRLMESSACHRSL